MCKVLSVCACVRAHTHACMYMCTVGHFLCGEGCTCVCVCTYVWAREVVAYLQGSALCFSVWPPPGYRDKKPQAPSLQSPPQLPLTPHQPKYQAQSPGPPHDGSPLEQQYHGAYRHHRAPPPPKQPELTWTALPPGQSAPALSCRCRGVSRASCTLPSSLVPASVCPALRALAVAAGTNSRVRGEGLKY